VTRNLDRDRRSLLLTFDDGPDRDVTPAVLERLQAYDARAVFFVVGRRAASAPDLVAAIHEGGHRVGNHTYSHRNDGNPWFLAYLNDVRRCQHAISHAIGAGPVLFRPPRGHLSPTTLMVPSLLGLRVVNWSLNVRDWACRSREEALEAARELDRRVQPGDIVLLHDDNRYLLDLLDYLLPSLRDRGFDLRNAAERL
jgi:peptidoglycan/xylan/chitin deacetylase (PgdA/CDA1 family)